MVFACLCSIVLSVGVPAQKESDKQLKKSIYEQVVTRPDPTNGYEDYVRAADLTQLEPFKSAFQRYSDTEAKESPLKRARALSAASDRVIQLIRVGNAKGAHDPREKINAETLFVELAPFRSIAKSITARAFVEFSSGRSNDGCRDLLDGLAFGQNIVGGSLINYLVSVSCQAIVMAEFSERLSQLSLSDATAVLEWTTKNPINTSDLIHVFQMEHQYLIAALSDSKTGTPKDILKMAVHPNSDEKPTPQESALLSEVDKLTSAEITTLFSEFNETIAASNKKFAETLNGPEKDWKLEEPSSDSPLIQALIENLLPTYGQVVNTAVRIRTQRRLLRLHARIAEFRWENRRLPTSLVELNSPDLIADPLTGKSFTYLPGKRGFYELYSEGNGATNRIDLQYQREAIGETESNGPPTISLSMKNYTKDEKTLKKALAPPITWITKSQRPTSPPW